MLNNYLFAADAAAALRSTAALPWRDFRGCKIFERCGLAVARSERRVIVAGLSLAGNVLGGSERQINVVVDPGTRSKAELIRSVEHGVLVAMHDGKIKTLRRQR